MSDDDWEEEIERIMDSVYDWGVEYSKTHHFEELTEEQKGESEAIVMFFTEYMTMASGRNRSIRCPNNREKS